MKVRNQKKTNNVITLVSIILLAITATCLVVFFETSTGSRYGLMYRSFVKGEIAEEDVNVFSSVDIIDKEATEIVKTNASDSILPLFSYNSKDTISILSSFDEFRKKLESQEFDSVSDAVTSDLIEKIVEQGSFETVGIAYDIIKELLTSGYFYYDEVLSVKQNGYSEITVLNNYLDSVPFNGEKTLSVSDIVTTSSLDSYINTALSPMNLDSEDIYIVKFLVGIFCKPNVHYDEYITSLRKQEAYDNTVPVVISLNKGDPIILKDHVIEQSNLDMLKLLSESAPVSITSVLTDFAFLFITIFGAVKIISYMNNHNKRYGVQLFIITVFIIASCIFCAGEVMLMEYLNIDFEFALVPVCFVPVISVMMTGRKSSGYQYSALMALMFCRLPGASIITFFYFFGVGLACCYAVRLFNKRIDMLVSWLLSVIFVCSLSCVYCLISKGQLVQMITMFMGSTLNVTVAYLFISVLLPILERILNLPTTYRLHELAFSDSRILTRLANVAPGTYNHSCAVAELSELGAKEIGANSLLCRVGGMYHDIGKIDHPEYFIENQSGNNKHDDINPSLSASIIKNHVKVGAQKGRDLRLPEEIIEIIENHHGNDVIAYFYNEAVKENKTDQKVSESDFTYSAEIPSSKECGIVMLADAVEAASRTVPANPQKYNKLIESIFLKKLEHSQLDNCGLTTGDLRTLRNTFVKALLAKNHSRIEYPDQEEDK